MPLFFRIHAKLSGHDVKQPGCWKELLRKLQPGTSPIKLLIRNKLGRLINNVECFPVPITLGRYHKPSVAWDNCYNTSGLML